MGSDEREVIAPRIDRRTLLCGGLACAASRVLGCGQGETPSPTPEIPCAESIEAQETELVVDLNQVPSLREVPAAILIESTPLGRPLIMTHPEAEVFVALDSRCTHQWCTVGATLPELECPCHGARFDLLGEVVQGPALFPLSRYALRREGDCIVVDVAQRVP